LEEASMNLTKKGLVARAFPSSSLFIWKLHFLPCPKRSLPVDGFRVPSKIRVGKSRNLRAIAGR
jgi:hypothetical protein